MKPCVLRKCWSKRISDPTSQSWRFCVNDAVDGAAEENRVVVAVETELVGITDDGGIADNADTIVVAENSGVVEAELVALRYTTLPFG
jgi:hypothetical protein